MSNHTEVLSSIVQSAVGVFLFVPSHLLIRAHWWAGSDGINNGAGNLQKRTKTLKAQKMKSKQFIICRPNYKTGVVWCQHKNGKWAPPFPMGEWDGAKEKTSPEEDAVSKIV